jgi:hypothetical protein
MAYMDEMALEREKSKQAMIAGKTPLLGADTTSMLHALGVNLGVVPPGTPPSQMTQLLEGLVKGPGAKNIRVDEQKPLQVQQLMGKVASLPPNRFDGGDDIGAALLGAMPSAKDKALNRLLQQEKNKPPVGGGTPAAPGTPPAPGANRNRLSGNVPLAKANDLTGVDPKVALAAKEWAQVYNSRPDATHTVQFTSGKREGDPREHGRGNAFDMQLIDKSTGKALENYRTNDPKTFKAYQDYANGFHQYLEANHPDLAKLHRWGGYFSGDQSVYGSLDQMHHDFAGDRIGMAGGSWKDGLSPGQAKLFPGLVPGGGLAGKPPMAPGRPTLAAPAAAAPAAQPGNRTLVEQRRPVANFFDKNPTAKDQMAAAAYTEDNNSREGRIAVHEAGANRIIANGRPVTDIIDPKYYQAMNDPAMRPKYDAALKRIQTDPQFRAQLHAEIDEAHKKGTNYSNLATDFGSGKTAASSKTNSTHVGTVGGNDFFIKNKNPEVHGGTTVANNQKWQASTAAELKKDQGVKPAAALTPQGNQVTKEASPPPAPAAAADPAPKAAAPPPQAAAPAAPASPPAAAQLGPSGEEPLEPEPAAAPAAPAAPAVAAPLPPAPAAAAAPVKPPAATPPAPQPVAKPAPPAAAPVNPAHALLDTKVVDLVKRGGTPDQVSQAQTYLGDRTLRQAMDMPLIGSRVAEGVKPYLGKMGVTQQQLDAAYKEGPPKAAPPGKRSDLGTSGATDFSASKRLAPAPAEAAAPVDPNAATLDPLEQKPVQNDDGSISTVRTIGVEDQGKEVNIPTVPAEGGRVMSDAEARQRYVETGKHLGKFDTVEQAGAAAEKLHQDEAARISEQPKGQQGAMTPEMAKALTDAYKDESRVAPDMPAPPADAMPVLPAQPATPAGGTAGGLSLAPPGLSSIPTGAVAPGAPGSQGGSIALAGMLPPIENATFSSPLIDQTAARGGGAGMGLSPIAPQILQGWGWGGGSGIGAGLDWGGGGGFDFGGGGMPMGGTGGW